MADMRWTTAGVASAWWVRLSPTIRTGTPERSTTSRASGSAKVLNSAVGVWLPRSVEPPMKTISLMCCVSCGSSDRSRPIFVIGPVTTTVTGSGESTRQRLSSSLAVSSTGATVGSGRTGPSSPLTPWT